MRCFGLRGLTHSVTSKLTHSHHFSGPVLEQCQHDAIGRFAAEGVSCGFTEMVMHHLRINLLLDALEDQSQAALLLLQRALLPLHQHGSARVRLGAALMCLRSIAIGLWL